MNQGRIVFGGISCRLPESDSPEEFWENLIQGKDMVTADAERWSSDIFPVPKRSGKVKHPDLFDAHFFEISARQTEKLDPLTRLMLEVSYEAILDAGFNPQELRGSNTGVFMGCMGSEASALYIAQGDCLTGYEAAGVSLAMLSNRVSFFYDFCGPSVTMDTACSSSLFALHAGINAILNNKCDYALVGGANLMFTPNLSVSMMKFKMLSPDGISKVFDKSADGYVRADGIVATFITRESRARRTYAHILNCAVNSDGYKKEGVTFPSKEAQASLLRRAYDEIGVDPSHLAYYEAHGTGTPVGDPQEVAAVDEALCKSRDKTNPLVIGSVKSNIGHTEGTAGLASVMKVLLAMHHGEIPPNIHLSALSSDLPGIPEGRIKVVTERTPWSGGLVGISSFGFGGSNAHLVLEGYHKDRHESQEILDGYSIVPCSSRTEAGLDLLLQHIHKIRCRNDAALFLQSIASTQPNKMGYRGVVYRTLNGQCRSIKGKPPPKKPSVCYVFNGMGTQWPGMASDLMTFSPFKHSIDQCDRALANTEVELIKLFSFNDNHTFNSVVNTFPCIAAIQIAFFDILRMCGLEPDFIIGHSVGEIACGYADGCLSLEQAMQISYWRGRSISDANVQEGAMASVNLKIEEAERLCPDDVVVACHNTENSVTVSGNKQAVHRFVKELESKNIQANVIPSSGKAFHSPLIRSAASMFNERLEDIIPTPKRRSTRWVSTSRTECEYDPTDLCSPGYYRNNLLNPVLFYEGLKHLPNGSVVIEIGARPILWGVLTKCLQHISYISLMRRDCDNITTLLDGLSRCYIAGLNLNYQSLLNNRSTFEMLPRIPGLMAWDHHKKWPVPKLPEDLTQFRFEIDLKDDEYAFLSEHKVNKTILFPAMGYLYLVWKAASRSLQIPLDELPIQFEDVRLHSVSMTDNEGRFTFVVSYLKETHAFEIREKDNLLITGNLRVADDIHWPLYTPVNGKPDSEIVLSRSDVYKEFRLRGYDYGPHFQGIDECSMDGSWAKVRWDRNWITFLDGVAQTNILSVDTRATILPTFYRRLTIDPRRHHYDQAFFEVHYDRSIHTKYCSSFIMEGFIGLSLRERMDKSPILASVHFSPYYEKVEDEQHVKRYMTLLSSYAQQQVLDFLKKAETCNRQIPEHLTSLKEVILVYDYKPPRKECVDKYLTHPNGVYLRLIDYVYKQPEKILDNADGLISEFQEYNGLYKNDLTDSLFHNDDYIRESLGIVMENCAVQTPIRICEIGNQKSVFPRQVIKMLRSIRDVYVITNYSNLYLDMLKNEFGGYSGSIDYQRWDFGTTCLKESYELIIAGRAVSNVSDLDKALTNIKKSLKDGGFLLLHIDHGAVATLSIWGLQQGFWNYFRQGARYAGIHLSIGQWKQVLTRSGFNIVSVKESLRHSLLLCRKPQEEKPIVQVSPFDKDELEMSQKKFSALRDDTRKRLWFKGSVSDSPGLTGFVKSLRKEPDGERVRCLFMEDNGEPSKQQLSKVFKHDLAVNVFRNGIWGTYQYRELPAPYLTETTNAHIQVINKGDFSTLRWIESPHPTQGAAIYDVNYCALNFKDIMLASGKLPAEAGGIYHDCPGLEFSGIRREDGKRIMGLGVQTLSTRVVLQDKNIPIWEVPEYWSLEEAATVPLVYLTVYLGLMMRARLKKGHKVLIHSGSGGIGIAALNLALSMKCEVFTTAGSEEKRKYIREEFPQIAEDHIANSRDTSFEKMIFHQTGGRGVDIVLNSLSGEGMMAGLRVLARNGHFVEIGKFDIIQDTPLGMSMFMKDISFHGVDLTNTLLHNPKETTQLKRLFEKGIRCGVVRPLNRTVFDRDEIEQAFRYMARAKHIGKVIIRIRDEKDHDEIKILAKPKFQCDPKKVYLITGGLGGFGLELADWLVRRGAKNLFITSRKGIQDGYQAFRLKEMTNAGAEIRISKRDIRNYRSTFLLIKQCEKVAPLGGIFHLAMVMSDALFLNQDKRSFDKVCSVKLKGAQNLSRVSSDLCHKLDHFVCFSSIVAAEGNEGQTNYAYANAGMDRLCEQRRRRCLPGLSIQWGLVGDVGFIQKNAYVDVNNIVLGSQSIRSCLETLDILLNQREPVVTSFTFDHPDRKERPADLQRTPADLVNMILKIFGLQNESQVDMDASLSELGMDSLMSIEIRLALEYGFNIRLGIPEIRKTTMNKLQEMVHKLPSQQQEIANA